MKEIKKKELNRRSIRKREREQVCRSACGVAATGSSYSDGEQTVEQPGDQACFIPVDTVHRHYIDKVIAVPIMVQRLVPQLQTVPKTGEVPADAAHRQICAASDQPGDQACRDSADQVYQQGYRRACAHAATGPSVSDCGEGGGSPAGAAHERMHEQIVDVPVPQKINEGVEPGSRDSAACGDATTFSSASNCGKDGGFHVDQPGDQQDCRSDCGDAANGPSYSDFVEDCESPAGVVRRQSCGGACVHADAPFVSAPVPQIVEEPIVPQFQVENAEEAQLFPHERISELTIEVDDVHLASATVAGKCKKKKKKKRVADAPTEVFHDEDSEITAFMSRLKGEWLEKSHAFCVRRQCKFHAVWGRPAPVSVVRPRTSHVTPRLGILCSRPQRERERKKKKHTKESK